MALHSVSVAGVVVDDRNRVLVIRRADNDQWQAPGGVLELGETFETGVAREVHEETGVTVAVEHLTGVYKNMPLGVVALVYRCRPLAGNPQPTPEAAEATWMPLPQVRTVMAPAFAVRILDAFTNTPHSRAHNGHTVITT